MPVIFESDYLAHEGVKGMRWRNRKKRMPEYNSNSEKDNEGSMIRNPRLRSGMSQWKNKRREQEKRKSQRPEPSIHAKEKMRAGSDFVDRIISKFIRSKNERTTYPIKTIYRKRQA